MTRTALLLILCLACMPLWAVARQPARPAAGAGSALADLPLVEVRPNCDSERLAVFYSGDGG